VIPQNIDEADEDYEIEKVNFKNTKKFKNKFTARFD
jgi:hypothetical protein